MNPSDMDVHLDRLLAANRMAREQWASPEARSHLLAVHAKLTTLARERFGGRLNGKLVCHCGMDLAGAAWSLASVWLGGAFLGIDSDPGCVKQCVRGGSCDYLVTDLIEAIRILRSAVAAHQPVSVGLAADPAEALDAMVRLGVVPDLLIHDSTSNAGACRQLARLGSIVLHE